MAIFARGKNLGFQDQSTFLTLMTTFEIQGLSTQQQPVGGFVNFYLSKLVVKRRGEILGTNLKSSI